MSEPKATSTLRRRSARRSRTTSASSAWQLRSVRERGVQTYLAKDQLEAERRTDGETHEVSVFVKNGDMVGRAGVTLQGR